MLLANRTHKHRKSSRNPSRTAKQFRMEQFEERTMFTACTGDLTGDYMVGFDDFLVLTGQYGQTVDPAGTGADFDGSGDVGFGDFLEFSENYGRVCEPDLVVRNLSIREVTTDAVFYDFTITNVGDAPANMDGATDAAHDNLDIQTFVSADKHFNNAGDIAAGGRIISGSPMGDLMPGQSVSQSWKTSVDFDASTHPYLTMKVDWGQSVDESNERNNTAAAKIVSNEILDVSVQTESPAHLANGEKVFVDFDYMTEEVDGVRLWARPMTNGELSPGYGAHGSPIHTDAIGSGTGWFTFGTENVNVDQIRVQMRTHDSAELLDEMVVDVDINFGYENEIFNVEFDIAQGKNLDHGDLVNVSFDYTMDEMDGVRIFARPLTNGALSPGYGANPSPIYMDSEGDGTGFFTINSGLVRVDQVRLQMRSADQSELLATKIVDVDYLFGRLVLVPNPIIPGGAPEFPITELPDVPERPELPIVDFPLFDLPALPNRFDKPV